MVAIANTIDRFNTAVGRGAAWCALAIVLLQFVLVMARYVLGFGSIWLSETIVYAHAALFLLAAAWVLQKNAHVRVDVFYAQAPGRVRAIIDLAGAVLLLFPFTVVLLWFSIPFAARSWAILERSQEASGLPLVFVLKTLILLFAMQLALQSVAQAMRALVFLRNGRMEPQGAKSTRGGPDGAC